MKPISTLVVLILSAGLISCSSDKKQNAQSQPDEWPIPDIVVNRKDGGRVQEFKKIEHEGETTDSVGFVFEMPEDSKTIRLLTADSECTPADSKEPVFKNSYKVEGVPTFRFFDALSNDLLVRPDPKIKCTFKIVITNSLGSTISYELLRLTLDRKREDQLVLIKGIGRDTTRDPIPAKDFADMKFDGPSQEVSMWLYCTHFRAKLESKQLALTRLSEILTQPLKLENGTVDPRRVHPIQSCRIVTRDASPAKSAALSAPFRVDFGPHDLTAAAEAVGSDPSALLGPKSTIFRITLRNNNPYSVSVALPRDAGVARISTLYRGWFAPAWGVKRPAQASRLSLEAHAETMVVDGQSVVNMAANSAIEIAVTAAVPPDRCLKMKYYRKPVMFDADIEVGLIGALIAVDDPKGFVFEIGAEPISKTQSFVRHGVLDISSIIPSREFYQFWEARNGGVPSNFYDKPMSCL